MKPGDLGRLSPQAQKPSQVAKDSRKVSSTVRLEVVKAARQTRQLPIDQVWKDQRPKYVRRGWLWLAEALVATVLMIVRLAYEYGTVFGVFVNAGWICLGLGMALFMFSTVQKTDEKVEAARREMEQE